MALDEYKFIVPEEETNDEKIADLNQNLFQWKKNYRLKEGDFCSKARYFGYKY